MWKKFTALNADTLKQETYSKIFIGVILILAYLILANIGYWLNLLHRFLEIVSPIIYATIIAYILYPLTNFLASSFRKIFSRFIKQPHKVENWANFWSVQATLLIIILAGFLFVQAVLPPLIENIQILNKNLPPNLEVYVKEIIEKLQIYFPEFSFDLASKDNLVRLLKTLAIYLDVLSTFFLDLIIIIIMVIYFLLNKKLLFASVNKIACGLLSPENFRHTQNFFKIFDAVVGKFIIGISLDAIIVGIVSTLILLVIGHPFAVLCGSIAGILNIIPYIGPLIGAIFAGLLGLFISPQLGIFSTTCMLLYQQIDGNIIQPKLVGSKVGLAAVHTFIALTLGGRAFGIIGMVIAIPVAAVISIYFNKYLAQKNSSC